MIAMLAGSVALAAVALETAWVSSFGPDTYGLMHLELASVPSTRIGVLGVGGTQPALLGTASRQLRLGSAVELRAELQLGMLRERGPATGIELAARLDWDTVDPVLSLATLGGMGSRASLGVDAALSDRWTLRPRLWLESWAGQRDPALRVGLGLGHCGSSGVCIGLSASAGGRDVLHMGPGISLDLFLPSRS